ncbi:MAG: nucleotidyltransferase domain-containing protein [Spirochaetaceae bacterium]|nr:nucleotidyltransferase domain-containing protein [Spirochaetaceae bacterium]RKX94673.1 MAG: hypothetical protein DRZ90_11545 [Spirochaetota bacterium]
MKGINDRLQVIKKALENEPLIELALVYGSTARGDYRPDSDADIAVAGKKKFSISTLADIAVRIEKQTGITIDIIDLYSSEGLILYESICGIPLVDNPPLRTEFTIKALGFKEDFLPQLNALKLERARRFSSGY